VMLWTLLKSARATTTPSSPRGVFGGSYISGSSMDYITIATTGNATSFGNLTVGRGDLAGVSSGSRGVFGGGTGFSGGYFFSRSEMDYITIATTGNATSFGNLSAARRQLAGVSSATRGVFGGGNTGSFGSDTNSALIDYITIATTGNATSFGNLSAARRNLAGVSNGTRGVFGGGYTTAYTSLLDYITIATAGNATALTGSNILTLARGWLAGVSDSTRGVFGGGYSGSPSNRMDYLTIATGSVGGTFGNLTVSRASLAGVYDGTRGVFGGGSSFGFPETQYNTLDYITIATTGNATDFGDLTAARRGPAGVSGT